MWTLQVQQVEQEWTIEEPELSDKGDLLEMFHLLFIYDSTFLFGSLQDTDSGAQAIHDHYAQFGLVIHVRRGDKESKIEAMHLPAKLNQEPIPEGARIELRGGAHIHLTTKSKIQVYWIQGNLQAE
jgi:hypothetical protein